MGVGLLKASTRLSVEINLGTQKHIEIHKLTVQ